MNYCFQRLILVGLMVASTAGFHPVQALTPPPPIQMPDRATALFNRGLELFLAGNYQEAIAQYNLALQNKPRWVEVYIARGEAKRRLGDYQGAIADSTRALQLDTQSVDALTNRCAARYGKGDYAGAIADCSQSLSLDPMDADALYNRALAYRQQGAVQPALNDLQQAVELYQQQLDLQQQAPLPTVEVPIQSAPVTPPAPALGVPAVNGGEPAPPQPELLRSAPTRGQFSQPRGRGIPGRREAAGTRSLSK